MPELKFEEVNYRAVDYNDWDKFIAEVYGVPDYSITADEEYGNDENHEFRARKEPLDTYDANKIVKLKEGRGSYTTSVLMNDLCNRGLIEEGTYLIKVSW
jgi:hypothetical protein